MSDKDYTEFPTVQGSIPPPAATTTTTSFTGGGTIPSGTVMNFGGPSGISINGNQGIWSGAVKFSDAPFSVDTKGNVVANTLVISGFISSGAAAADVNSHATTISGGKITAASITASQIASATITASQIAAGTITSASGVIGAISANNITTGTLDASVVTVNNLTANNINTGTLNGSVVTMTNIPGGNVNSGTINTSQIAANAITSSKISVSSLSAIAADMGTITAGAITGGTITGVTVTGGTVRTSSTGHMVRLDGNVAQVSFYNGSTLINGLYQDYTSTYVGNGALCALGNFAVVAANGQAGDFAVQGTKAFDIPHPTKDGMRLKYVAMESPEVLVLCRGVADTEEEITYPQHFTDVTESDSIQCQIGKLRGSNKISWIATGIRKGYAEFEPEYYPSTPITGESKG